MVSIASSIYLMERSIIVKSTDHKMNSFIDDDKSKFVGEKNGEL